jgi:HD superfamily phosphohydrolase
MKVIRDAVWGDIEVGREALALLDTPEMQRLRGIRQLGTAALVYPSAVHTRFEHALGTMHLARRILAEVGRRGGKPLPARLARATELAALLHDVTHIPFGHTLEDERRLFPRHDSAARMRRFLARGELGRALRASGLAAEVEATLAGAPPDPLMGDVVAGTIGADLLDYLARDAYFCGFHARWDERLLRYFERSRAGGLGLRVVKEGLLRSDALSEVLSLLWLRYALSERVYYHHAKVAAGAMISKAVEIALGLGLRERELYALTDEGLVRHLRARFPRSRPLAAILARYEARRLYKRAFVLTPAIGEPALDALVARFHDDRAARARAEAELAAAARIAPEDVIVHCPAPAMAAKEPDVPILFEGAAARSPVGVALVEMTYLKRKHHDLWRFYVFVAAERRAKAPALARAAERLFRETNEIDLSRSTEEKP